MAGMEDIIDGITQVLRTVISCAGWPCDICCSLFLRDEVVVGCAKSTCFGIERTRVRSVLKNKHQVEESLSEIADEESGFH